MHKQSFSWGGGYKCGRIHAKINIYCYVSGAGEGVCVYDLRIAPFMNCYTEEKQYTVGLFSQRSNDGGFGHINCPNLSDVIQTFKNKS